MNNSENDPHTQGTQLLQLAQELEQNGEYKEAISKMKQARDILVDANFWGEEEVAVIEEELNRLAGLASSEEGSDPQSQGMELLQSAQESEKNGKYREAIDQMRSARDILVGAGFWGQEESQTIDSEIDRLKGLLGSKYTSNAQLKGTNLLEQAQQAEESGDHESAIEKMEEARDILVDAKIWGSDESK